MKISDEKMAGLCQIVLDGIFGISEFMSKEENDLHKKFLEFHIKELLNDFDNIILTIGPMDRMFMENILYNYDMKNFRFNKESLSEAECNVTFERVLKKLRYPKNAKNLEKYIDDNWQNYVDKKFD